MTNVFFILAMGRSGTKFLSNLLNRSSAEVSHEIMPDFLGYQLAYRSEHLSNLYFSKFRNRIINQRITNSKNNFYGEVNGLLRRSGPSIKLFFPNAPVFHLFRDGRDVVRSMYSRKTFRYYDPGTYLVYPDMDDPYRYKWDRMSHFEKLCWYWAKDNECLRKITKNRLQFESIVNNYDYFKENLLDKLDIRMERDIWEEITSTPKNITRNFRIPHWTEWPVKYKESFNNICAHEMANLGYDLSDF